MNNDVLAGSNTTNYPDASDHQQETIVDTTPQLYLPIDDDELLASLKAKESATRQFLDSKLNLEKRQKRNKDFWRGNHYENEDAFEKWQVAAKDNVIYEDLETRITLASARMPDIIVTPPNDNNEAVENAPIFEDILDLKINNAFTQRLIKRGLRSHHLNFFAVAKGRWDPNLANGTGDFVFELVRPDRIIFDHTATIPDNGYTSDNMDYIIEYIEEPINVVLAKFPAKAGELKDLISSDKELSKAGSKLRYQEAWFTWYDEKGDIYEGVCWKYKDLILDKKRNPYYDWEGYTVVQPKLDSEGNFKQGSLSKETKFYNYMERPRKPYIFFSYQNLDESPIDDTTPVEQAIPLQKIINRTARQVLEISDNAVPKRVFAGRYIQKEEARRVSSDPDESIWLDGADDVSKAFMVVQAQPPSPELIALGNAARARIDALFSAHPTTKGENTGDQSGISKQISREGDLTMSDDLVDIVVERVVYELAGWATQFMKLFYDQMHYIRQVGNDGNVLFKEFSRKNIADGIMHDVKASSTDAQTRRSDAINLASRKATDPLTMFEDMELPNPKERVRRLISFLNGSNDAFATYMAEIDVEFEHQQEQQPPGTGGQGDATAQQAQQDLQNMVAGQDVAPPDHFDATYVQVFVDFVHSGQFDQLDPEIKQNFQQYIQELEQNFGNFAVSTPNGITPPINGAQAVQGAPPGVQQ